MIHLFSYDPSCPLECRLYGAESTGEIQEHDAHSVARLFQVGQ